MRIEDIGILELKEFKEQCKNLTDTRNQSYTVYKIWDVVTTAILAIIADANTFEEIQAFGETKYKFLKSFMQMTGGIPTIPTYENIIGILKPEEIINISYTFISKMIHNKIKNDIIPIDGKVDKASSRYNDKPLNVLNAVSSKLGGMSLYSIPIEDKTNEIPMFKEMVKHINVKGNIITVDALNTQKDNAKLVRSLKGDYVFAVKGNQGNLYKDLITYFGDENLALKCKYNVQTSKEGSSLIKREYFQTEDIEWLDERSEWEGLKSIGCVKKTTTNLITKKITVEIRYYISSLKSDIVLFADCIRSHWKVENNLHWQLDFTFKCDDNTTSNKSALFNLQLLKKLVLSLLKIVKVFYKKSLIKIRYIVSLDVERYIIEIFNMLAKLEKDNAFSLEKLFRLPIK